MVASTDNSDGFVDFTGPDKAKTGVTCRTWYKLVGSLNSTQTPLVIVHGGPGACHEYLLPLVDLNEQHGVPLLFYDQIGNGKSTRLPHLKGDETFWTEQLFSDELGNLLAQLGISDKPYDLYGHSWGGMLVATWAARKPKNLRKLIIASSLASMDAWRTGVNGLRNKLPDDVQETLRRCEEKGDYESEEFQGALEVFYKRHLSLKRPWPCPEVSVALDHFASDGTTYETMYGVSELHITGSLRNWTSIPYLKNIEAPTFLINGEQDEAQDVAMQPFFDHIPKVKWAVIDNAAHFVHVDKREENMKHLSNFLVGEN